MKRKSEKTIEVKPQEDIILKPIVEKPVLESIVGGCHKVDSPACHHP